jgi:2-oxoglutarate ferredoxin oxidoreductase subunit beta
MEKVFEKPKYLMDVTHGFCPGCMHGIATSLVMQTIDKFELGEKTIIVWPVGCGPLGGMVTRTNYVSAGHGRAPAVATGIKRSSKDSFVLAYQGDGDLASIGTAETIHAANRGENITVIFVNNTTYGMTGGQMAPTTMLGQVTTTSPYGRSMEDQGAPLKMAEVIATLDAPKYVARFSLHDAANVLKARKGIEKAFQVNLNGGYSFVELISNCPTNWKMTPEQTVKQIAEHNLKVFPLGVFKEVE